VLGVQCSEPRHQGGSEFIPVNHSGGGGGLQEGTDAKRVLRRIVCLVQVQPVLQWSAHIFQMVS
jgi:hypothetical protein